MACNCEATDRHFGPIRAQNDLAAYRRRGATGTARRLLRMIGDCQVQVETLLDIGAGVGILHHELLARGVSSATHVEASRAFVEAAQEETGRRGQTGRVEFLHGDFLALAPSIAQADLVTLDRVICCYPEYEPLLLTSAALTQRYWAASFPRERWYVHLGNRWENWRRARAGNAFRTFIHPVAEIYRLLAQAGLRPLSLTRRLVWETVVCIRES
ncbi:MAG TPA: class I SAM-dependent methyltransferase [Gemmatimonadales bacterium]